jgi:hypothetical protein
MNYNAEQLRETCLQKIRSANAMLSSIVSPTLCVCGGQPNVTCDSNEHIGVATVECSCGLKMTESTRSVEYEHNEYDLIFKAVGKWNAVMDIPRRNAVGHQKETK